jgi:hypothetical protein
MHRIISSWLIMILIFQGSLIEADFLSETGTDRTTETGNAVLSKAKAFDISMTGSSGSSESVPLIASRNLGTSYQFVPLERIDVKGLLSPEVCADESGVKIERIQPIGRKIHLLVDCGLSYRLVVTIKKSEDRGGSSSSGGSYFLPSTASGGVYSAGIAPTSGGNTNNNGNNGNFSDKDDDDEDNDEIQFNVDYTLLREKKDATFAGGILAYEDGRLSFLSGHRNPWLVDFQKYSFFFPVDA